MAVESILTNAHHASHLQHYNLLKAILSPLAAALLKFVNWRSAMIQLPKRNFMLVRIYFLANLRRRKLHD